MTPNAHGAALAGSSSSTAPSGGIGGTGGGGALAPQQRDVLLDQAVKSARKRATQMRADAARAGNGCDGGLDGNDDGTKRAHSTSEGRVSCRRV